MPHLLAAISAHGFGHLAQVAPVLNRLRQLLPGLRLTLRTTLPLSLLRERIEGDFELQAVADDFGMLQHSALEVDLPASLQRYRRLHANWAEEVRRVAAQLAATGADLVFADIPYLTLAAAQHAAIPAVAMCSLNWQAILQGYLPRGHAEGPMLQQMQEAYASAELFLRPSPAISMPELHNTQAIGVVASCGRARREALIERGVLHPGERLLLLAMGGMEQRLPLEQWPQRRGLRYAVPGRWQVRREDCLTIEECGMPFSDLLASSDVVITKPGYGIFTEAALSGVPVLYVRRGDWAEEEALIPWLEANASALEIRREALERGAVSEALDALDAMPARAAVEAGGVDEAARLLRQRLGAGPGRA